jgi:hypothetical protein
VAAERGLTPREVGRRYRVNADRVRNWIRSGALKALDLGRPGKPRFIVLPSHLADFEQLRQAPTLPARPRRRRRLTVRDYYPDVM